VGSVLAEPREPDIVVLDASVLVELVIAGRHRGGADALLARYAAAPRLVLVSAAHGLIEATSAIRGLGLSGHMAAEDGLVAVDWLRQLALVLDATAPRLRRVWTLRDRMTAYDAAYVAAAEAYDAPLLSTDRPLLRACLKQGLPARHLDDLARGD
jgi:predicted nucleic acid-binding protein